MQARDDGTRKTHVAKYLGTHARVQLASCIQIDRYRDITLELLGNREHVFLPPNKEKILAAFLFSLPRNTPPTCMVDS